MSSAGSASPPATFCFHVSLFALVLLRHRVSVLMPRMRARALPPSLARSCELACWREASGIPDPPHASGRCSARACRERPLCPAELQEPRSKPAALTHVVVVAARFGQYPKANRTLDTVRKIVSSQAAVLRRVLPKGSSTVLFVDNATPSLAGDVMREECARHGLRYALNGEWSAGYGYELGAWRWAGLCRT